MRPDNLTGIKPTLKQDPRTVFHGLDWSCADSAAALAEGWDIFDIDSTGVLEIQAHAEGDVFVGPEADTEARGYVNKRACEGSALHLKALACIAQTIVEAQIHSYGDDIASDIAVAQAEMNTKGTDCDSWGVNLVSQLTILRSAI